MVATVTLLERVRLGKRVGALVDILFDNSYPTNGEAVTLPLRKVEKVLFESKSGYMFEYITSTGKVKVYTPVGALAAHSHAVALDGGASAAGAAHGHAFTGTAEPPALVVEEAVTVAANVGTLVHLPLYIAAVHVTAGGTTGAFKVIPNGKTPLTQQVAVNFTTGAMTFLGTDAVTAAKVTYIPKRGSGYLSAVTVDEAVTAAAAKANLAARAGLVQYVWDDTDSVLDSFEQPGTAPSATHFCTVDINDAGNSSIDSHADDEANALKVTYVPFSQLPPGCFIDDTDITLNAQAWNFTGDPATNGYNNLVVPAFGNVLIGETGAAARSEATLVGPSGTAANGVATWNPATNVITTAQTVAMTIASMPWMILSPLFLTPATPAGTNANESTHTHGPGTLVDAASGTGGAIAAAAAAELANLSSALDGVTVRALAIGY